MVNIKNLQDELSQYKNSEKGKVEILNQLSKEHWSLSPQKALDYGKQALELSEMINEKEEKGKALNSIGVSNYFLTKYDLSLEYFLKSLKTYEELGMKGKISSSYNNIGMIYVNIGKPKKALEYYKNSLKIDEEIGNKRNIANSLNNTGNAFIILKKYDKALEYYKKALKLFEESDNKPGISAALNNIGDVYLNINKNQEKALKYLLKSLKMNKEIGDKNKIAISLLNIGDCYTKSNNSQKALIYLDQGLKIAQQIESKNLIRKCYRVFSELYFQKDNYKKSLEYFKLHSEINDTIYTEKSQNKIAEMQAKFDTEKEKKEAEIYRLKNVELAFANEQLKKEITERKRIETKLKQNENTLRQIIDTTPDCIFVKDRNGKYLIVNRKMAELHNTTPEKLVGKYDQEIAQQWFETVDYNEYRKAEQDVIDNKKILREIGKSFIYQNGTKRWFKTTKIFFEPEKNKNCILVVSTDITEIKLAEEKLKAGRERTKILNKIMRHDITNDLVVIRSALHLYRMDSETKMLDEIEKKVNKSLNTIKRLREQEFFIDSHSDLNEYNIENVLNDIIANFPDVNINIEGSGVVYADEAIYSVFENLISNAINHGNSKEINVSISTNKQFCEIKFKDFGPGISYEIKDKIFEEGFIYGEKGNTGIGLYIAKQTIEGYGGIIFVENNNPTGAIFIICLKNASGTVAK
ncbi:MAG: tetratricopeptide repeat protein [Candidatus Cloacimonetes bacterium]|nr:tetratricopeptide repeat protein [Candidatus Cloacimonadota bacterium]